MVRIALLALAFAASLCLAHPAIAQREVLTIQVDDVVQMAMTRQRMPGMSIAVNKDGKTILAKGYGLANIELNVPATSQSVYEIGSVTKQFTAVCVMLLVEEGKLGLDEKINKYLTGLPEAWNNVTVRNLLNHTSGLRNTQTLPNFGQLRITPSSQERLIGLLKDSPRQFAPGTKFQYCNTGYLVLGWLIEKSSGMTYANFLQTRICKPLEMHATRVYDPGEIIKDRASGYVLRGETLRNAGFLDMSWPSSAGAIISNVEDLAKWNLALDDRKLLKPESYEAIWTPVKLADGNTQPYGFGWNVTNTNGRYSISHGGSIDGYRSFVARFPDSKLSVVVLTNGDPSTPAIVANRIARLYDPTIPMMQQRPGAEAPTQ